MKREPLEEPLNIEDMGKENSTLSNEQFKINRQFVVEVHVERLLNDKPVPSRKRNLRQASNNVAAAKILKDITSHEPPLKKKATNTHSGTKRMLKKTIKIGDKNAVRNIKKTSKIVDKNGVHNIKKTTKIVDKNAVHNQKKTPKIGEKNALHNQIKTPKIGDKNAVHNVKKTTKIGDKNAVHNQKETPKIVNKNAAHTMKSQLVRTTLHFTCPNLESHDQRIIERKKKNTRKDLQVNQNIVEARKNRQARNNPSTFICNECLKCFSSKYSMKRHIENQVCTKKKKKNEH